MGLTYSHEHLLLKPGTHPKYRDYILDDPEKIIEEILSFKMAGGRTIIEMTPINFGREVFKYRDISERTGINVAFCTGFHKEEFIPLWVYTKTDKEIIDILLDEINHGVKGSGLKPAVLKFGTSFNRITEIEERVIKIIIKVHKITGLPISTHCDKGTMALEQAEILLENGVEPERVVFGHVDIQNDVEYLSRICSRGFNVLIDHLGRKENAGDAVKIDMIKSLIEMGYKDQIFLSGDMGKRSYLKSYGGNPGFEYILTNFREKLLLSGIDDDLINHFLIDNPKRLFCIRES
ncbi:MAG: 5-phospho-D-xylono,4-lactonase [Thermoanaerobacterium sp.]|nr:5-phospho-D-xylono,4-lactonase [Thermoanaerobacterium sp.]